MCWTIERLKHVVLWRQGVWAKPSMGVIKIITDGSNDGRDWKFVGLYLEPTLPLTIAWRLLYKNSKSYLFKGYHIPFKRHLGIPHTLEIFKEIKIISLDNQIHKKIHKTLLLWRSNPNCPKFEIYDTNDSQITKKIHFKSKSFFVREISC